MDATIEIDGFFASENQIKTNQLEADDVDGKEVEKKKE
jgi:hypothetical protein